MVVTKIIIIFVVTLSKLIIVIIIIFIEIIIMVSWLSIKTSTILNKRNINNLLKLKISYLKNS